MHAGPYLHGISGSDPSPGLGGWGSGIVVGSGGQALKRYDEDDALVAAAARGERAAKAEVARRLACVPRMVRVRRRQLGAALEGREDDLVQDVVLAIWSRLDRFRGGANLEAWAWGFVLRMSYKRIERIQRRPKESTIEDHTATLEDQDLLSAAERTAGVQEALADLDEVSRKVVHRRHFQNQSFEDIGQGLAMPTNTAKTRYYRALKSLATRLRPFSSEQ